MVLCIVDLILGWLFLIFYVPDASTGTGEDAGFGCGLAGWRDMGGVGMAGVFISQELVGAKGDF